jgi:membrane protease YdiL (CAAX protease family)
MLFARSMLAVIAACIVASALNAQGSAAPWRDATRWFPIYATLIDAACLTALWFLMRREGARLIDLLSWDGKRLGSDVLFGLALMPPGLALILGGVAAASFLVYGAPTIPMTFETLPLPATLYAVIVFPLLWGFTEQMTYNGYAAPRIQVLGGAPAAVALVAFFWSAQHAVMPVRFDADYMLYRTLAPIPFSIFIVLVYLRVRRILPLAIAHWLMDAISVLIGAWPTLR